MTTTGAGAARLPGFGHVDIRDADDHRVLTSLAAGGLLVGLALAAFGMPPVDLHPPLHRVGVMSPTCGMTRGVAAALRGDMSGAWAYNPASLLVVAGALVVLLRSAIGIATGRWVTLTVDVTRMGWLMIAAALFALWLRQQGHMELLVSA